MRKTRVSRLHENSERIHVLYGGSRLSWFIPPSKQKALEAFCSFGSSEVRVVTIKSKVSTFLLEGHNLISRGDRRRTTVLSTFAIKQPLYTFIQVHSSRDTPRWTSCPSFPSFLPSFFLVFFSSPRHGSQLRTKQPLYL